MSSTTLYRVSGISLLLGALISLIATLLTFFMNTSFTAPPATFQSPLWSTHYSLFFTALALTLIGLPALYFRLRGQRGDRLGFFGLLFILLGTFLALGMAGYFVSVLPVVATKAPQILTATLVESGFGIFPLGGTLFGTIGTILLGIAVLRAKVFPTLVGILLLAWAVLNLLNFVFQSGLLATLVGLLSTIASAAAYGWVGVMLVQQQSVQGAQAPEAEERHDTRPNRGFSASAGRLARTDFRLRGSGKHGTSSMDRFHAAHRRAALLDAGGDALTGLYSLSALEGGHGAVTRGVGGSTADHAANTYVAVVALAGTAHWETVKHC